MGALVAAYIAVWLGVSLFVLRLGMKQKELRTRLDALTKYLEPRAETPPPVSKAA